MPDEHGTSRSWPIPNFATFLEGICYYQILRPSLNPNYVSKNSLKLLGSEEMFVFRRKKEPIQNQSVSFRQLLHSRSEYDVAELPGSPTYVAAGNVSRSLTRHLSNARNRAASFFRNHLYIDIANVDPSNGTDGETRRASVENPYEVVIASNQVYSFAGESEELERNNVEPSQCTYNFASDVEQPKYATIQGKHSIGRRLISRFVSLSN